MIHTKSLVILALFVLGVVTTACNTGAMRRNPGKIYAPDMTYSRAYDAYTASPNFSDSESSRKPVIGTVARGQELPDHLIENDSNQYKVFTTSLRFNDEQLAEGGRLFNIYCGVCHGTKLDGNGPLYNNGNGPYAAAPANFKLDKYLHMPIGQMYAAVKYGKNAMGSYASQLDIKQRWMVLAYLKQWQSKNGGDAFVLGTSEVGKGGAAPAAIDSATAKKGATPSPAPKG